MNAHGRVNLHSGDAGRPRSLVRRTWRSGLGLFEAMLSLAICAMLLTAAGSAFSASAQACSENDTFFRASQAARVCMNQMLAEIRRSKAVSVSADQIDFISYSSEDLSYAYDTDGKCIKLITNASTADADYTLCSAVTAASFTCDTVAGTGGISTVMRVSVTLTVTVGKNSVQLTGSAAPRRTQTF